MVSLASELGNKMIKNKILGILFAFLILLNFNIQIFAASNGSIQGYVKDAQTDEPLVGANILLKGTSTGAATDLNGFYSITNIPAGKYTLIAKYLGYNTKKVDIQIIPNKTIKYDFQLKFVVIKGEEVVVTSQAEGQMNAINQQLSGKTIKNVVSAKQIQEIPDANAAEAVGRLPGISLLRSGGEGNKVVIRGLSPQYNRVEVEGVKMAATGSNDRSTDLSMISPYMLEAIEVRKAALPDQEADVIGGSVNFVLREAPNKLKFNALAQSGYNGLKSEFGDYKFVVSGSNRFFDNKLGLFALVDIEKRNRSSYELNVNYTNYSSPVNPEDVDVSIGNLLLNDIARDIRRYGTTLVLDYKLPNGKIKLSNFISRIERNNINRIENYRPFLVDRFFTLEDNKNDLTVMNNSLKFEYNLLGIKISSGISYAYSENTSPRSMSFRGYQPSAFNVDKLNVQVNPKIIPSFAIDNINEAYLFDVGITKSFTRESEISGDLNLKYEFNLSNSINLMLKTGAKFKHLNKRFDTDVRWMPINWGGGDPVKSINKILEAYPWMQKVAPIGSTRLPYGLFVDKDYNPNNFLGGDYTISNMPQLDLANNIADLLEGQYFFSFSRSKMNDYFGSEDYSAGYLMSEIKFGNIISVIPGVRYEKNSTSYNGNRGNDQTKLENKGYAYHDTTTVRENGFWLPMVHVKIKPLNWFDIRFAYTKTLARPNFRDIIPFWNRGLNTVAWNNPFLKPSTSQNYDLYLSVYNNDIGLLTIGGFYKEIKDLIFWAGIGSIIDPKEFGLPEIEKGKTISRMVNNKFPAYLSGFEIEWQTHFWYLPGLLKGLVLTINYTHTFSETKYPRTEIQTTYLNKPPWVNTVNIDTFFVDRLINQPNNILNLTLGYDYKGFSTRISMLYQDDVFKRDNFYRKLRGTSDSFFRWDFSIRQKLPIDGLEMLLNINNLSSSIERDVNVGTGFPQREQHYGLTSDVGIRYRF